MDIMQDMEDIEDYIPRQTTNDQPRIEREPA